ncbi:MAG: ABC transporter ATP-binding protein [bacterium]
MSKNIPVKVENVSKVFRDYMKPWKKNIAVDDISFSLESGTVTGFIGHNGAGKTTTIKMLMGFISPTEGDISLFGESPRSVKIKHRIGYLPEHPYFSKNLTAKELLRFFGSLSGIRSKDLPELVKRTLRMVSLSDAADIKLASYSKGMLQRAGLAQAIIHSPEILILDEPMSGLDPAGRRDMKSIIRSLKKDEKTVLFSSHILSDVEDLSDTVILLEKGKIKTHKEVREMLSSANSSFAVVFTVPGDKKDAVFARYKNVRFTQGRFHMEAEDEESMNKIVKELQDKGCVISQVGPKYTSLEDVI